MTIRKIWVHDEKYAQDSIVEKLARVRADMQMRGIATLDVTAEDDVAWLCNLRGSGFGDEYTPKFRSAMRIEPDQAILYVDEEYFQDGVKEHLAAAGIEVRPYGMAPGCVTFTKCYKTRSEIENMKRSHIGDGVIVTKFIYRLKKMMREGIELDEIQAAKMIDDMRAADPLYVGLSFTTIDGYGPHGAVIHYMVTPETNVKLEPHGFMVLDSGGQYLDGTTDITRTIALGELTDKERLYYTYVMQGMLRLLDARITKEEAQSSYEALAKGDIYGARAVGRRLDDIARKPLRDHGLDYAHGTGHGVGYLGEVHELPVRIPEAIYRPGLVMSDEPGVYIDGEFGVRIENLMLCTEDEPQEQDGTDRLDAPDKHEACSLRFESLTWCPLERAAVAQQVMTDDDRRLYNEYQSKVWETISPYLDEDEKQWLREETAALA